MSDLKGFVLTTRQTPWRTESVMARFAAAGLQVEPFEGVHGATLGIATTLDHFDSPGHKPRPGQVALAFSKLLCWTMAVERLGNDEPCLIFEDDAVLVPNFKDELAKTLEALPADWGSCQLGSCCTDGKPAATINDRIARIPGALCDHAVAWKRWALWEAISRFRSMRLSAKSDIWISEHVYSRQSHYLAVPPLAFQEHFNDYSQSEAQSSGTWQDIRGWSDFLRVYDEALDRAANHPSVFVEIGAFLGRSAAYMGGEIGRRMAPVTFFTVDPWIAGPWTEPSIQVEIEKAGGNLFHLFQRNISRAGAWDWVKPLQMTSVEAAKLFDDRSVDFFFEDGCHEYEYVKASLDAWRPKMKPSGVMAGHDVDRPGVLRAVEETFPGRWRRWERTWIADRRGTFA